MSGRESFDDALDAAIDQIRSGIPLADVLAAHSRHAEALRPLLETSRRAHASGRADVPPMPSGLADNFTIVRVALERQRMSVETPLPRNAISDAPPWWQRRFTIASMSVPAGVVLFLAFAGAGGAAAATVTITNPDLASRVASIVAPEWAENIVPTVLGSDESDDDGQSGESTLPTASSANSTSDGTGSPNQGKIDGVTVSGVVEDAHGNTFTLAADDRTWKVQLDSKTDVSGEIVDGAQATVTGIETGSQTVHAERIVTVEGIATTPTPTPGKDKAPKTPPGQGADPGNENGNPGGNGNGNGGDENSNAGGTADGAAGANAPPGQVRKTPSATAVVEESGNAGGNGNGNGNGGGPKKP